MDFVAFIVDCVSCRCRLRAAFEMRWLATQVSAESESKPAAKSIWCSIAECTALALLEHLLERFAVAKIEPLRLSNMPKQTSAFFSLILSHGSSTTFS